jgi:hypothetical protein
VVAVGAAISVAIMVVVVVGRETGFSFFTAGFVTTFVAGFVARFTFGFFFKVACVFLFFRGSRSSSSSKSSAMILLSFAFRTYDRTLVLTFVLISRRGSRAWWCAWWWMIGT